MIRDQIVFLFSSLTVNDYLTTASECNKLEVLGCVNSYQRIFMKQVKNNI